MTFTLAVVAQQAPQKINYQNYGAQCRVNTGHQSERIAQVQHSYRICRRCCGVC